MKRLLPGVFAGMLAALPCPSLVADPDAPDPGPGGRIVWIAEADERLDRLRRAVEAGETGSLFPLIDRMFASDAPVIAPDDPGLLVPEREAAFRLVRDASPDVWEGVLRPFGAAGRQALALAEARRDPAGIEDAVVRFPLLPDPGRALRRAALLYVDRGEYRVALRNLNGSRAAGSLPAGDTDPLRGVLRERVGVPGPGNDGPEPGGGRRVRWRRTAVPLPTAEHYLSRVPESILSQSFLLAPDLPSRGATPDGDRILLADARGIASVDPASGHLFWESPAWEGGSSVRDRPWCYPSDRTTRDDDRVYAVRAIGDGRVYDPIGPGPLRPAGSELVTFDRRDGRILWRVEVAPPRWIVGGALAAGGILYLPVQAGDEGLFLLRFDPRTGMEREAPIPLGPVGGFPHSGCMTVSPAGRVYVALPSGAVACVDPEPGRLRWARRYGRYTDGRNPLGTIQWGEEAAAGGWLPDLVAAPGDRIVYAPPDGERILCLDGTTGDILWSVPRPRERGGIAMLVGIGGGRVVIAGARVEARALEDGRRLWSSISVPPASGRGLLAGSWAYLPSDDGIRVFDIRTGICRFLHAWPEGTEPGHLDACGDGLLVTGRGGWSLLESVGPPAEPDLSGLPEDLAGLVDPDPSARDRAVLALVAAASPSDDVLRGWEGTGHPELTGRIGAILEGRLLRRLGERLRADPDLPDTAAARDWLDRATGADPVERWRALRHFFRIVPRSMVAEAARTLYRDAYPPTRALAGSMGFDPAPGDLDRMATLLDDPVPVVRSAALQSLGGFRGEDRDRVGALASGALGDPDPEVRRAAAALHLSVRGREGHDRIRRFLLDEPDPGVRQHVLAMLLHEGVDEPERLLLDLFARESDVRERNRIALELSARGCREAIPALREALTGPRRLAGRMGIRLALLELGEADVRDAVRADLIATNWAFRSNFRTVLALARAGDDDPWVLHLLVDVVRDGRTEEERREGDRLLGEITGHAVDGGSLDDRAAAWQGWVLENVPSPARRR